VGIVKPMLTDGGLELSSSSESDVENANFPELGHFASDFGRWRLNPARELVYNSGPAGLGRAGAHSVSFARYRLG